MMPMALTAENGLNRRIGGLENPDFSTHQLIELNRRIGGLETIDVLPPLALNLNRRIGGLEKQNK